MLANLSIAKHQSWNHWWVDSFHYQISRKRLILPIGLLRPDQILLQLFVKEVVSTALFLRLENKFVWILKRPLDDFIDFGPFFAEILQAPDALE